MPCDRAEHRDRLAEFTGLTRHIRAEYADTLMHLNEPARTSGRAYYAVRLERPASQPRGALQIRHGPVPSTDVGKCGGVRLDGRQRAIGDHENGGLDALPVHRRVERDQGQQAGADSKKVKRRMG